MCGLRQSVGFLPFRSSVFCLPWAEKPCSVPACLARHHHVSPESTRKTAAWRERPLVAMVQMIVTCAKRQKRMCLVEETGERGPQSSRAPASSCSPGLPPGCHLST